MMSKHYSVICAQDGSTGVASGDATDHQLSYIQQLLIHNVKAVLFVCAKCRRKGDVARRLFQLENASECANEKCQAAERLLQERQTLLEMLLVDKGALQKEIIRMQCIIDELRRRVEVAQLIDESASLPKLLEVGVREPPLESGSDEVCNKHSVEAQRIVKVKQQTSAANSQPQERPETSLPVKTSQQESEEVSSDGDNSAVNHGESSQLSEFDEETVTQSLEPKAQPRKRQGNVFPYPPGFKQIQERVGRFIGKHGDEDFEVWLADFREATADCKWTDQQRAQWFSWFLSDAAKSTWQRTLHKEEKKSWSDIVRIYKGHYGVHMEPRTAYLRCHELRYEDFLSLKGLLESMKDYQRMAPDQLTDDNLLSILWNKAPYRLQKEVGDIKDWSLQELFEG